MNHIGLINQNPSKQSYNPTFLNIKEVVKLTRLSVSTLRRLELSKIFPKRHKISPKRVIWIEQEIRDWMNN